MKILLGGIPLGCDNIGDEAIIASVVGMVKSICPDATVAVATADGGTADLLGVSVVPAFGFVPDAPIGGFAETVRNFDAYIWAGATGLSDYPDTALDLLEIAQNAGVATFIWGVGMDSELNPVFFRASGRRRQLLSMFGAVGLYERFLRNRLARRIRRILPRCKGIYLRDEQSRDVLATFGIKRNISITADSALFLSTYAPHPNGDSPHNPNGDSPHQIKGDSPHNSNGDSPRRLGLCISAQRAVSDLSGVGRFLFQLREAGIEVVGIPMNPKTDAPLMRAMGVERIAETLTPFDVVREAAICDLVLSSRLHLLILSANVGTPVMGIARGSKLSNFLANFGDDVVGSVADCDWDGLAGKVVKLLEDSTGLRRDFVSRRDVAYAKLAARFESARKELKGLLECANPEAPVMGKSSVQTECL